MFNEDKKIYTKAYLHASIHTTQTYIHIHIPLQNFTHGDTSQYEMSPLKYVALYNSWRGLNASVMSYCPSMTCKQWHCNKHASRAVTTVNREKFRQNSTISTQYLNVRAQFKANKNPDNYITLIINKLTYYQYFKLKNTQMHHTKGKTKARKIPNVAVDVHLFVLKKCVFF